MNALRDAVETEAQDTHMSPDTPTSAIPHPRWRILGLIVVHIIVGLMGADIAYASRRGPTLYAAAFIGLIFSQTSLLGICGSLGESQLWRRFIAVAVGIGYLSLLLGIGMEESYSVAFSLVVAATSFVAMPLLIARAMQIGIHLNRSPTEPLRRLQFSIRHLLVLMIVVACVISVGKVLQNYLDDMETFVLLLSLAFSSSVVGVLPVWCVLGTNGRILYRIGLLVLGACPGFCLGLMFDSVFYLTSVMVIETAAVVVSLLVVRSCGYRLVRLPKSTPRGSRLADFINPETGNPDSQNSSPLS
jgi:hypothetical protein